MSSHRASLLAGLRTGGPRSVSGGAYNVPQTATVVGQFPSASAQYLTGFGYEQEGNQFIADSVRIPMTAPAKDATFPQFQQQQQAHLMLLQAQAQAQALQNAVVAGQGGVPYGLQSVMTPDQQALHLQLEVYKMQARSSVHERYITLIFVSCHLSHRRCISNNCKHKFSMKHRGRCCINSSNNNTLLLVAVPRSPSLVVP